MTPHSMVHGAQAVRPSTVMFRRARLVEEVRGWDATLVRSLGGAG